MLLAALLGASLAAATSEARVMLERLVVMLMSVSKLGVLALKVIRRG
jgi:hypothetical protein